ncbi:KUP system potassium uptake protein, partial [Lecanoromycetidae sp. Uapishka_2]
MNLDTGRVQISEDAITRVISNGGAGIYARPRGSSQRSHSLKGQELSEKDRGIDDDDRDLRKAQHFHGKLLFWQADLIFMIENPLYVYSSTFASEPSHDDLLGALSLIIWTLTLMVSVKYIFIVLRADDEGEGGTFAVYSLLSRYANIVRRDPREERSIKMERINTSDLKPGNKHARSFMERSRGMKALLKVVGVLGVSLVMSDGVLTPAQSVLGAIQGLEVVQPDISKSTIVGTTCAILILLFVIQPLGTSRIGTFSPYFAGAYFVRNKTDGWRSLGGILLAFTGVEALFADLGAFSRPAIQLSWMCFAFPCLLLAYIGQAAYISQNTGAFSNPFFNSVPPGMFYPSLVIAILAAIVASQTMITATFQLLSQIIKLSYFPQIKVKHTSKIFHGQIYIPWVNWLLMIGTICVTAAYSNTTKLGEAYGVCVILVTFITTCMVSLVATIVWRLQIAIVIAGFLIFGTLDGLYLSSALTKVPDGAWFTLCLAVLLSSIFVLWRYGKEIQWAAEAEDRVPPSQLLIEVPNNDKENHDSTSTLRLTPALGGAPVSRLRGVGVFFDKTGSPNGTPTVFVHFLQKFQAAPTVIVFFHIRPLSCPTVPPADRFSVTRCFPLAGPKMALQNIYRVTIRHGYGDQIMTSDLGLLIYENLRAFIIREGVSPESES